MTRRIGKRTREAAIHCLEQCASDRIGGVPGACLRDGWNPGDPVVSGIDACGFSPDLSIYVDVGHIAAVRAALEARKAAS